MKRGRVEERGRVLLVSTMQLSRLELAIPKLWTIYFVHSAVALCEITSAWNTCKITAQQRIMFNKIVRNHIINKFPTFVPYTCMIRCKKFGKKRTTFCKSYTKKLNGPKFADDRLPSVLNLRCLWILPTYDSLQHISTVYNCGFLSLSTITMRHP